MIIMLAKAVIKPETRELYEKTFKDLQKLVKANEPDVFIYELCKDPEVENGYYVVEAYKDEQTQIEHLGKDYYLASSPVVVSCLAGDHMEQIKARNITDPAQAYELIKSLKILTLNPV
jgi:quinol monooxygenase YgiN